MILPITLTIVGAAALLNFWLAMRVGKVRGSEKVSVGDGGNERVIRRMRAHANFAEFTPIVLILIAAIELATGGGLTLWIIGALYILVRIAHAFGMDRDGPLRACGIIGTALITVGLALWAIAIPYMGPPEVDPDTIVQPMG